jgi:hypothetical protein
METDHFIDQVLNLLRGAFRSDDPAGSMTAARVGSLIRTRLGDPTQMSGYPKLKNVLEELERRGAVRTGANSKGAFSIWLLESPGAVVAPPHGDRKPSGPYRPLRQPLWNAFVATAPQGRRFMNRLTGELRFGISTPPEPNADWVEIPVLSESEDRAATTEFLKGEGVPIEGAVSAALAAPRWFTELPRAIPSHLAGAWKRRRTGRVVELAERWRRENHLSEEVVYDDRLMRPRGEERAQESRELRTLLLEAVQRMSTDELLSLPIPARHLVTALRPDLIAK